MWELFTPSSFSKNIPKQTQTQPAIDNLDNNGTTGNKMGDPKDGKTAFFSSDDAIHNVAQ